jgi:hypothetical protein
MSPGPARASSVLAAVVFVIALAPFLPGLDGQFLTWDDDLNFLTNPHFRGLGWSNLRWMLTTTLTGHWIPLSWLTLGVNYTLGGMNPWGYHLGNMLLHAGNAVLLYLIARRLLARAGAAAGEPALSAGAVFAALLFAVHPLRVESVVWITERRDVQGAFFFLLSVWGYLYAVAGGRDGRLTSLWRGVDRGFRRSVAVQSLDHDAAGRAPRARRVPSSSSGPWVAQAFDGKTSVFCTGRRRPCRRLDGRAAGDED